MKTILITGGKGFIGSHTNKLLKETGYQTVIFDNLSTTSGNSSYDDLFFKGDLLNKTDLKKIFTDHRIDAVMHFAAYTDVGESIKDPFSYYRNNLIGTINLLEAMVEHGIKILVFSSSAAIFGFPQKNAIDETHPCEPINAYGQTKWMVEKILQDYERAYQLRFYSLRYFNAAGGDPLGKLKTKKLKENNLIPIILENVQNEKPITIFGTDYPTFDGTCIRDYIHVVDLAQAHLLSLEKLLQGYPSNYYNLGNGNGFSIRQVIQAIEKIIGIKVKTQEGPRRPGDPPILIANAEKAFKDLQWKPRYPDLETIISHAWISK